MLSSGGRQNTQEALPAPAGPGISPSGPGSPRQLDGEQYHAGGKRPGVTADGPAQTPSSGQMAFGKSLSFLSTGFLINKTETFTVTKYH